MTALSYQPVQVTPTLRIQGPLTRRGDPGPGLLIIQDAATEPVSRPTLDPEPLRKWAEEGYTVVRIEVSEHHTLTEEDFRQALSALTRHDKFAVGSIAIIAYSMSSIPTLSMAMELGELGMSLAVGAVVYYGSLPGPVNHPHICHLAESGIKSTSDNGTTHRYPEANSASFVLPSHPDYLPASAAVAHSRTLEFLKKQLDGPWFDLEAIWEEHTRLEFADRAVEATMNTMVQEPYVNHIPTMTGGIGRDALTGFYANHFIFSNPEDTELQLISRTVGVDRVVDEFIFSFTHDRGIDWLYVETQDRSKGITNDRHGTGSPGYRQLAKS